MLEIGRVRELVRIERECVRRCRVCDRNCAACDLVQDDRELIDMYNFLLNMLEPRETVPLLADDNTLYCDACGCAIKLRNRYCPGCGRWINWEK